LCSSQLAAPYLADQPIVVRHPFDHGHLAGGFALGPALLFGDVDGVQQTLDVLSRHGGGVTIAAAVIAVIAVVFVVVGTGQVGNFLKLRPVITTSERDPPATSAPSTAAATTVDDLVTVVQGRTLDQPSGPRGHLLWDTLGD
jgi:hypothetical protein